MPSQRSTRNRASQNTLSQPSTSTGKRGSSSQSLSQKQSKQTKIDDFNRSVAPSNINEHVNNLVRYLVNNAKHHGVFRKAELQRHALPNPNRQFEVVMEKAVEVLRNVYGYNVLVCDQAQGSGKSYVLSNALPYYTSYSKDETEPDSASKILLLLVLSHLFMSNAPVNEAALYAFLKNLDIDPDEEHPLFGNVKDCISQKFVKQKYLASTTDSISKRVSFDWGIRAEKEISKQQILKFVCKIYKNCQLSSWQNHLKVAEEQGFENDKIPDDETMQVDE